MLTISSILICVAALCAGVFILWLFFKLLGFSIKILWKLIINAAIGAVILIIVNIIGGIFGLMLPITFLSALVAGVFGIPGVVLLIILALL